MVAPTYTNTITGSGHRAIFLVIPGLPKILSNARLHWAVKAKENAVWRQCTAMLCRASMVKLQGVVPFSFANITFTRVSSNEPDFDNLAISFKAVLDGLKDSAIIWDDKSKFVNVSYRWEKGPMKGGYIRIEIEEKKL